MIGHFYNKGPKELMTILYTIYILPCYHGKDLNNLAQGHNFYMGTQNGSKLKI
jgi:hypothetical protein